MQIIHKLSLILKHILFHIQNQFQFLYYEIYKILLQEKIISESFLS